MRFKMSSSDAALPFFVPDDLSMPYPRICAHRGFKTVAPENSLAAFGAAIAMGADEIELDVRFTRDGVPVVAHDSNLDRVSNGSGTIEEKTLSELYEYDFGIHFSERFANSKIALFEEVLSKFSRHAIFNLHLKNPGSGDDSLIDFPQESMEKIVELLYKYNQQEHVYFMGSHTVMEQAVKVAPEIARCMGAFPGPWEIIDRAIKYKCRKAQIFLPYINQEMIDKAHANNIKCNLFYCDDPVKVHEYLDMGIDTILTNDYWTIANALKSGTCGKNLAL